VDIDSMQTFVAIAQLGGFTRAAGRLHRSQPAISRRIGLLEQELGAPLLERMRGAVQLTEVGRAFLPFAEAALAAVEDGRAAVRAATRAAPDSLSLALVGTLADTHVVDLLRRFAKRSGQVRIDLRTATSSEVSALVRRGDVTLGLRYFDDDSPDLVCRVVGEEALVVVVSPEHRLARLRPIRSRQLRGERWVGFPAPRSQRESFGSALTQQLAAAGLGGAEVMAVDSLTAQKRLVEAGFGLGLLPASSVREERRLGSLRVLNIRELRVANPVTVVYRRKGYLGPAARELLGILGKAPLRISSRT
jgi:DNA-binding transcriptional LysR family regulator